MAREYTTGLYVDHLSTCVPSCTTRLLTTGEEDRTHHYRHSSPAEYESAWIDNQRRTWSLVALGWEASGLCNGIIVVRFPVKTHLFRNGAGGRERERGSKAMGSKAEQDQSRPDRMGRDGRQWLALQVCVVCAAAWCTWGALRTCLFCCIGAGAMDCMMASGPLDAGRGLDRGSGRSGRGSGACLNKSL